MIRALTDGEIALARSVFGDRIELAAIRLVRLPAFLRRAFVPGRFAGRSWIFWPAGSWGEDLSQGPLRRRATLVHELVHVWQAQQGINLLIGKLRAGDGPKAYAYRCDADVAWDGLNIEQQASVVEHRYLLAQGATVPGSDAFYQRVCPF